ncbi:unnamed protein product [Cercospora beticola]|nr:unnamed protein product [Cercospora beticola]
MCATAAKIGPVSSHTIVRQKKSTRSVRRPLMIVTAHDVVVRPQGCGQSHSASRGGRRNSTSPLSNRSWLAATARHSLVPSPKLRRPLSAENSDCALVAVVAGPPAALQK